MKGYFRTIETYYKLVKLVIRSKLDGKKNKNIEHEGHRKYDACE